VVAATDPATQRDTTGDAACGGMPASSRDEQMAFRGLELDDRPLCVTTHATSSPRPRRQRQSITSYMGRYDSLIGVALSLASVFARLPAARSQKVGQNRSPAPRFLHDRGDVMASESASVRKNVMLSRQLVRLRIEPE
jgi:hypothetical protein